MRCLRAPLVHFVAGGAALFCVVHGTAIDRSDPIVVTAADVERLRTDYARETGLEPSGADEAALVEKAVDEELLFREAVARGLDRNDRSVRNWLVEQMQVLSEDRDADPERLYARARALGLDRSDLVVRRMLVQKMRLLATHVDEQPPTASELDAFYAAHRDEYRAPERVTFWHVFVSSDVHGPSARRDAEAVRDALEHAGRPPVGAMAAGDAFPAAPHVIGKSTTEIAKLFGTAFAAAVARVEPGTWSGPLDSPYGAHLVWVERREASVAPPLEAVRSRVVERWRDERRARRLVELLHDLRRRHPLQVQSSAWLDRSRS
jgi:hypothetical protein